MHATTNFLNFFHLQSSLCCILSSSTCRMLRSRRSTAMSKYSALISNPTASLPFLIATSAVVPEPMNGSKITSPGFEHAFTIRSMTATGNCAGCFVRSGDARRPVNPCPVVTFGNCHTSVGFLPKRLTRILPFFFLVWVLSVRVSDFVEIECVVVKGFN